MDSQERSYQQAIKESTEYFGNKLSAKVFVDKYALRDENNIVLETNPDMAIRRVVKEFARIEREKFKNPLSFNDIYKRMKNFERIIPQGGPLYGIGNKYVTISLGNCFVVEQPLDSYGGILNTDQQIAQISKRRGGCGVSLDNLRPTGSRTNNSSKSSTGMLSWMSRYSHTIREVGQSGRRGALLETLNVHHPDIELFIQAKNNLNEITGANISTHITDEFLTAIKKKTKYEQRWPLKNPIQTKKVSAEKIWSNIIHQAWKTGEPGIQFIDVIKKFSPADCYSDYGFETITANPCGELPLSALDSCRLLLLNLFYYVKNPFTSDAYFDFNEFKEDVIIAQRLADDLIDLELECIDNIIKKIENDPEPHHIKIAELNIWENVKKNAINGRRTGTGITALGDTLAGLCIPYDSDDAPKYVDGIIQTLKNWAYQSSIDMAKELGPFPVWNHDLEKDNPFLLNIKKENPQMWEEMKEHGRRNISLLTISPAGSVSMMAKLGLKKHGTTSGFEPLFTRKAIRRKKGNPGDDGFISNFVDQNGDHWMEFEVVHPGLELATEFQCTDPYVCANEVNWKERVKLQAIAQKHIDHSISSTVNLPNNATEDDVREIYMEAWKSGCKGITVYRDGSRTGVIIQKNIIAKTIAPKRPDELPCDVHHISVMKNPYFVLVGMLEGQPYEVFAGKNGFLDSKIKSGVIVKKRKKIYRVEFPDGSELSPVTAFSTDEEDVVTRLISANLRHGTDISFLVHQLEKAKGDIQSFAKSIARALKKYIPDGTNITGELCPLCKSKLIRQEGCAKCSSCSWSRC